MGKVEIRDEFLASEVRGLSLDIGYANLLVREEATDKVTVVTARDEEKSSHYDCDLKNGILQVEAGNVNINITIFGKESTFHKGDVEREEVCITLPYGMRLEMLELCLGAGNAQLGNKSTIYERAELEVGAGVLKVDAMQVQGHIDMELGAGNIEMQNLSAQTADVDCGVGRMVINGAVERDIDIACGVGTIEMYLDAVESEYNYDIDCAVGSVIINGNKRGGIFASSSNMVNPNARGKINLDCGVGKIELTTQKRIGTQ